MRIPYLLKCLIGILLLLNTMPPASAGDSIYGKITEVRNANTVILDYGTGHYVVRIIGIDVPKDTKSAADAKQFVSKLVLGKNARLRLGSRLENGEMTGRLLADDPDPKIAVRDVGLELLRAGLVRRQAGEDFQLGYKYNELSTAERDAQQARRGVWANSPQPR